MISSLGPGRCQCCPRHARHVAVELNDRLGGCDDGVGPSEPPYLIKSLDKILHRRRRYLGLLLVTDLGPAGTRLPDELPERLVDGELPLGGIKERFVGLASVVGEPLDVLAL